MQLWEAVFEEVAQPEGWEAVSNSLCAIIALDVVVHEIHPSLLGIAWHDATRLQNVHGENVRHDMARHAMVVEEVQEIQAVRVARKEWGRSKRMKRSTKSGSECCVVFNGGSPRSSPVVIIVGQSGCVSAAEGTARGSVEVGEADAVANPL